MFRDTVMTSLLMADCSKFLPQRRAMLGKNKDHVTYLLLLPIWVGPVTRSALSSQKWQLIGMS